ncbi:hypothetical protein V8C37DRAFT_388048 [Trichoderma ceciliae]
MQQSQAARPIFVLMLSRLASFTKCGAVVSARRDASNPPKVVTVDACGAPLACRCMCYTSPTNLLIRHDGIDIEWRLAIPW